ncbi:hypothetical protein [Halalkalibacter lacteus]|uniref:hypothetical protein n=1 Tax=Halalkalibacter lacteus TaxID=3090663 RepID=UPI002FC9D3C6
MGKFEFFIRNDLIICISVDHPTDQQKLIIGSAQESIFETEDFGESWNVLAEGGQPKR